MSIDFRKKAEDKRRKEQDALDDRLVEVFMPKAGDSCELRGEIDFMRVINERSGWGFARMHVTPDDIEGDRDDLRARLKRGITVPLVGFVAELYDTARVDLLGVWKKHPKFGWQLDLTYVHVELPSSDLGVAAWLEERFPEIGPKRSRAIVRAFPPPTIWQVLAESPERLCEIDGIGPTIAEGAARAYEIHKSERESFVALASMGLKSEQIRAAIKLWCRDAVAVLADNPYEMRRLPGIGWKQADALARRSGVRRDDERRILEGLRYALEESERDGHTCRSRKKTISLAAAADILGLGMNLVAAAFEKAIEAGSIVEGPTGDFYRPETARAEAKIAERFAQMLAIGSEER